MHVISWHVHSAASEQSTSLEQSGPASLKTAAPLCTTQTPQTCFPHRIPSLTPLDQSRHPALFATDLLKLSLSSPPNQQGGGSIASCFPSLSRHWHRHLKSAHPVQGVAGPRQQDAAKASFAGGSSQGKRYWADRKLVPASWKPNVRPSALLVSVRREGPRAKEAKRALKRRQNPSLPSNKL